MAWHPREGWSEDGTRKPREYSRRQLLSTALAGAGALGLGSLLEACGSNTSAGTTTTSSGSTIPLPRPNNPVKWPIFSDNKAIAAGLAAETNATLQVYNWVAYINPQLVKNFAKKYKCKVQVTTFNTMEEALSKLRTGQIPFDVFFPTVDVLGQLVEAKLVQPLSHSYIPNITQSWSEFSNPFYDEQWQYTVPYTIYTTGMAWRKDKVPVSPYQVANGWAFPWQAKYRGKVAILDDYREGLTLGMLKSGITDVNTTSAANIATAKANLEQLNQMVKVQIDNNDYTNIPSGKIWIHHAWSGDMAAAPAYLPKGTPPSVIGYWFPPNGKGPIANDTIAVLKSSQNPVLAHLFLNYVLDKPNVFENITYNGYIQPTVGVTPQALVQQGILAPNLTSTAPVESDFQKGFFELELPPAVDAQYQAAWAQFSGGL